jgi:glycosyltransferase involved in cell wall biosynthesis
MLKLVFVFPYKGIGGVSLLFLRIGEYLSVNLNCDVYLVDYIDGFMHLNASKSVNRIEYFDRSECVIPIDSIVIFQTMTPWSIFPNLVIDGSSKLFFWNCHPYNLVPHVPLIDNKLKGNLNLNRFFLKTFLYPYWRKCSFFLKLLVEKNAIAFMDQANKINSEFFYFPLVNPEYLPIPAVMPVSTPVTRTDLAIDDVIHITWVGRIVDFKYYILAYTLKHLDKLNDHIGCKLVVTIIGGGEYSDRLKRDAEQLNSIEVTFIEHVNPSELDQFIQDSTDVMFAMGTSALEAAKLGIPTVLLDVAYGEVKGDYQYRFLYERDGSTLGDVINLKQLNKESKTTSIAHNSSLLGLLHRLRREYKDLSNETKKYFLRHHDIRKVSRDFLNKVTQSQCTYKDLYESGSTKRGVLYKLKKLFKQ